MGTRIVCTEPLITRPGFPANHSETGFGNTEVTRGCTEADTGFPEVDSGYRGIRTDAAERDCVSDGIDRARPFMSRFQS